jgi:hypothetical protein
MLGANSAQTAFGPSPPDHPAEDSRETGCPKPSFSEFLDQDASRFFYRWGGQLSSILIRIRARFDGDLDQYLLYLIFLLGDLSRVLAAEEAKARGDPLRPSEPRGMNALSLAEITRIPRETARRKLQLLVADGYLRREGEGLYFLADRYGVDAFFWDLKPLFWDRLVPPAEQGTARPGEAA